MKIDLSFFPQAAHYNLSRPLIILDIIITDTVPDDADDDMQREISSPFTGVNLLARHFAIVLRT